MIRGARIARRWAWAALLGAAAGGCGDDAGPSRGIPAGLEPDEGAPSAVARLATVPALGRPGPNGAPFRVAVRTPEIESWPCASCHEGGTSAPPGAEGAVHADVQAVHPDAYRSVCSACHEPSTPGRLRTPEGSGASLDEAWVLCAGCHFQQADDWAGGAHGKRLAGWRGDRVVLSCTGCHDPHDPSFPQRVPHPGPRVPRTGQEPR